jgi:hypothetical protein
MANTHPRGNSRIFFALVGALAASCAGCSESGPKLVKVRGKVTMQNRPLACGVLTFQPLENGKITTRRPSLGVIEADGTYRVSTFESYDGAMPGEYLVGVDGSLNKDSGSNSIDPVDRPVPTSGNVPPKYLVPQTSGLKATVPADASEVTIDFILDK